jgi:hypothetical protein
MLWHTVRDVIVCTTVTVGLVVVIVAGHLALRRGVR